MPEAFEKTNLQFGKAATFFVINAGFSLMFGLALFILSRNSCHTIRGSDKPVDPHEMELLGIEANNVTLWFNLTCFIGFVCYGMGAVSSFGYITNRKCFKSIAFYIEIGRAHV